MNEFNNYLEFISSLDSTIEEVNSIVNLLLQNNTNNMDIHSLLFYLSLLDRLFTCLNRDLQRIYYLMNK